MLEANKQTFKDTSGNFPAFCTRKTAFVSSFCVLAHQTISEKGSTLKGKNLPGANSLFLE